MLLCEDPQEEQNSLLQINEWMIDDESKSQSLDENTESKSRVLMSTQ